DVIEEQIIIDGIPIRLVDTAGLTSSECSLEQESVRRARKQIEKADINLHVIDASIKLNEDDRRSIAALDPTKTFIVLNKTDLGCVISPDTLTAQNTIKTQAVNHKGVTEVKEMISGKLGIPTFNVHRFTISERHRTLLIDARDNLQEAIRMLSTSDESYIVLAASNVKTALESIARTIGKTYSHELLDAIFSRFCIGK
ncbi:MAG: GTPase, partial [Candidatus Omnitrophota bacterium]